uniref:Uncharacterized protein n=1 Tax=Anopheles atroparvus TaxID=41427 RepID=A0AAG5CW75_ANOAO
MYLEISCKIGVLGRNSPMPNRPMRMSSVLRNLVITSSRGLFMCSMYATGASACIWITFALYSGLVEAITKNPVVPCEWPT